jgi:hypothetical protein
MKFHTFAVVACFALGRGYIHACFILLTWLKSLQAQVPGSFKQNPTVSHHTLAMAWHDVASQCTYQNLRQMMSTHSFYLLMRDTDKFMHSFLPNMVPVTVVYFERNFFGAHNESVCFWLFAT